MLKKLILLLIAVVLFISCGKDDAQTASVSIAQQEEQLVIETDKEKKALTPDDYAQWQRLANPTVSTNGKWVFYRATPNRGDALLSLHEIETGQKHDFEHAKKAMFSPDNDFMVFMRSPSFELERQAKIDKVKKDKMPKDSLCVYYFEQDTLLIIPRVKSFAMSSKGSPWIALHLEKVLPAEPDTTAEKDTLTIADSSMVADTLAMADSSMVADTTQVDTSKKKIQVAEKEKKKKEKKPKIREKGTPFWVWNPITQDTIIIDYVSSYTFSKKGNRVMTLTKLKGDPDSVRIAIVNPKTGTLKIILETAGEAKSFRFDEKGNQLAFLFSDDTTKQKLFDIYYWKDSRAKARCYLNNENAKDIPDGWGISNIRNPRFSKSGKRLFFGTALLPVEEPEDTLLKNEKAGLDLWSWTDPLLQTQQVRELAREKKRNYVAMVNVGSKKVIQLADKTVPTVKVSTDGEEDIVLGESNLPYRQLTSWEALDYFDYYLINVNTGEKELILEKKGFAPYLSPQGKYVLWFEHSDSSWYAYDVKTKISRCLTDQLDVAFYDEDNDIPSIPSPHGFVEWGLGDRYAFIYDRYDIWKFDLTGEKEALNVTMGAGRKTNIVYRYLKLKSDLDYIPIKPIILTVFNEKTKADGYATANLYEGSKPEHLIYSDHQYSKLSKAKNADVLIWRQGDYRVYPDLWVSDMLFDKKSKLSALNLQQSEYRWASVELVEWKNSDEVELQGMLYIPDDLNKSKKHPMILYYYEHYSQYLHQYFNPSPSRSTVNKTMYPSNGYILFIPDVVYKVGHPGKSALDCITTGVDMLLEKYSFIDEKHIGLQGQSWGGYQTAYFITQTDRFAAAMAGAPVSNMTSAYGGIRWYSGLSRMMQYEGGQSRIGGTLWDSYDLYIENSPVFFADQIETPLLIMHNDNDGAVPWTQGIEMMVAMRRLQKPAWMLVYNNEDHNLKADGWGNRMDLTIRMKQFFDYYLKDAPMPRWMKEGILAIEKGKELKYDLLDEE